MPETLHLLDSISTPVTISPHCRELSLPVPATPSNFKEFLHFK